MEEQGGKPADHGKLVFDPDRETFVDDEEDNQYLNRKYREPYVLPEKIETF